MSPSLVNFKRLKALSFYPGNQTSPTDEFVKKCMNLKSFRQLVVTNLFEKDPPYLE